MSNKTWFLPADFTFLPDGQLALGNAYSECDHEIRQYNGAFSPKALRAILDLESVKTHVNGGMFGKSSVYIITGQRVALHSFSVTNECERSVAVSVGARATAPAGLSTLPVDVGAGVEVSRSDNRKRVVHYKTAPGIVFAYRVHVIRPKGTGTNAELFSSRTAFNSGEVEFDGEDDEMEIVAVNKTVLKQDVELPRDYNFYEETIEGSEDEEDETYLHFLSGR